MRDLETSDKKKKSVFKIMVYSFFLLFLIGMICIFGINAYVVASTKKQILSEEKWQGIKNFDCILILGAGIWGDKPSPMLQDRLDRGIELYQKGIAPKILVSGDHGRADYDEVNIMKNYIVQAGVPSEDIFMDHAGFSTYDSIYRSKHIFEVNRMIIVTQKYHLYRALYIANQLGIKAYGVPTVSKKYSGQTYRDLREIFARDKDFVKSILKPSSKYLGDVIPVSGDGNITNDEAFSEIG